MNRERIGYLTVSYFEAVVHKRFRKVTLMSELNDCFDYFNKHSSKALGNHPIILIHGNGIEIKKVAKGKGYSIEIDGVVKTLGVDTIPKSEQAEIVRKIRNITFPYAEYKRSKPKKA